MFLRSTRLLALVLLASAAAPAAGAFAATALRTSALGDVAPFRAIAASTLDLAKKGDLAAAQKRGTELETAWDDAEDKLKPTDPTRWRVIDKAIDRVLSELRAASPQMPKVTAALSDLLATMDKGTPA